MGRIKTKVLKRITQKLMEQHSEAFSSDFAKNKEAIKQYLDVNSQKLANIVAGHLTKLVKAKKAE